MKKILQFLKFNYLVLSLFLIISFLFSYVLCNFINQERAYYEATFYVENIDDFDHFLLNDENFLNSIKNSADKYQNIDVHKMLQNKDFTYEIQENEIHIYTQAKYYDQFFNSASNSVGTRAKTFIKDCVLSIDNTVKFEDSTNIVVLKKSINSWFFALYGLLISFIIECISIGILSFCNIGTQEKENVEYDNVKYFKTIFHKSYFKSVFKPLKDVKSITTLAMLFALMLASKFIPIPSGFGNLGLSFTYLFFAIVSCVFGPFYGFIIGICSDTIGFFLPNSGGGIFHFGYTLQAALSGMIYGLCFYKRKITFSKSLMARFFVNIFMNAIYGSFLFILVAYPNLSMPEYLEKVKYYMLLISLPKNVLYLLPQSILLHFVLTNACKVLRRFKLIEN